MGTPELGSESVGFEDSSLCRALAIGGSALHHGESNLLFLDCHRKVLVAFSRKKKSSLLLLHSRLRFRHLEPVVTRGGAERFQAINQRVFNYYIKLSSPHWTLFLFSSYSR